MSLYSGTLVPPLTFHQLQKSGSLNQSLKASQPNVSTTRRRWRKSVVSWTQGRCPGREHVVQKIWKENN